MKGRQFNSWRTVGHVVQAAKIYAHRAVDEIILLNIAATPEGRGPNLALVEKIAKDFYTPLTVGGGVRSVQDVRDLLNAGADKVAICTHWRVIGDAAAKFGRQAIVASVDVGDFGVDVMTHCGRCQIGTEWRDYELVRPYPATFAHKIAALGAGEILLTSIEREGTMEGYDLELVKEVSHAVDVPVIAHGGAGTYEHLVQGIRAGASAVAAGAMFQFTDQTPGEAAAHLASRGIEARVPA